MTANDLNCDLWELILERLPITSLDSLYRTNKFFSKFVKICWSSFNFIEKYKKYNSLVKTYMILVSFKDSEHCEGFFVKLTQEEKVWFIKWFVSKFGKGLSIFCIFKCKPLIYWDGNLHKTKIDYDKIKVPPRYLDSNEVIINVNVKKMNPRFYRYSYDKRFSNYECFRWTNVDGRHWNWKNLQIYDIFELTYLCNGNYILKNHDTLIDYEKFMKFDVENCIKFKFYRKVKFDRRTYGSVVKWYEIERKETVDVKSSYENDRRCLKRNFESSCENSTKYEKITTKTFVKWTNMKGLYFAIQLTNFGDFISVFEDTISREYIMMSCIEGFANIRYPGYVSPLSDGLDDYPDFDLGKIVPPPKRLKYNNDLERPIKEKLIKEISPNELIDVIFNWENDINWE